MKRILLVDDNRLERKLITYLLQEHFKDVAKIDEVSGGMMALQYLQNSHYDVVISDLIMPDVDGLTLIRKIKNDYPHCNLIAISGSKPFYLYIAKKMGVHGIFTKPLDKERFLLITSQILNQVTEGPAISIMRKDDLSHLKLVSKITS